MGSREGVTRHTSTPAPSEIFLKTKMQIIKTGRKLELILPRIKNYFFSNIILTLTP
jgi:hypothetical protein